MSFRSRQERISLSSRESLSVFIRLPPLVVMAAG